MSSTTVRLFAAAAFVALPGAAFAQSGSAYAPPQLAVPGTTSKIVAGAGEVGVQVFVHKDGTFSVVKVFKTNNEADNEAALDLAKHATYKPATRDGQPVDAYYDYIVRFSGAGTVAMTGGGTAPPPGVAGSGPTASAYALIKAGKYAEAKSQLQMYLGSHPGDVSASTLLGVADSFSGDADGAAQAFDSVPNIPEQYRTLAEQSYGKHAASLIAAGKNAEAATTADRLIALNAESPDGYYLRGVANENQQKYAAAVPDLQKALDLAKAAKSDDKSISNISFNLAVAQLNSGAYQAGAATSKDAARIDPALGPKLDQAAFVAVTNDAIALSNAGKSSDAVARLENGATLFPASAGKFYGQASYFVLATTPPDYKKAKAEADKALALDPTNGQALYVNAVVASQGGDMKATLDYMTKAKASPLYASDPAFAKQVDDNLKKLTPSSK
jgi:tetratricopeptide (TPR) repeat protein